MLQWFQRLMPRQDAFFPAFERHVAVMVKAAVALREMVAGGDQLKKEILDLEHEADGIAREVLLGLRTTFITHPQLKAERPRFRSNAMSVCPSSAARDSTARRLFD